MEWRFILRRSLWQKVCPTLCNRSRELEADPRFEKELEKLRKEMELASATGSHSGPSTNASPWTEPASPNDRDMDNSPLVLPGTNQHAADMEVPELVLEKAAATVNEEQKSDTLKVRNS